MKKFEGAMGKKLKDYYFRFKRYYVKNKTSLLPIAILFLSIIVLNTSLVMGKNKHGNFSFDMSEILEISSLSRRKFANRTVVMSEEVKEALASGDPVVALESTIITHGMNYPVDTAKDVEDVIKKLNVTPATIVVINGTIHVGLNDDQFEYIGRNMHNFAKCSRRDLAVTIARNASCGTTVAATMIIADLVGIRVFVTGGIGGVHRNYFSTLDVSADLEELGRTAVCVVSAGVKSILDIPKTLEYLETKGVTVMGWKTSDFPSFYSRNSGHGAHITTESARDVAEILETNRAMGLGSGMLVGVPVPEKDEFADVESHIVQALEEVAEEGVAGKDVTPYLLRRVGELSMGRSVRSNIALIKNNAFVGAMIAREVANIRSSPSLPETQYAHKTLAGILSQSYDVAIVGASSIDIFAFPNKDQEMAEDVPGSLNVGFGGVARNILEGVTRLGVSDTFFISAVGEDMFGDLLMQNLKEFGYVNSLLGIKRSGEYQSAVFNQIVGQDKSFGVAAMDIFEHEITPEFIEMNAAFLNASQYIVFDASLTPEAMTRLCEIARGNDRLLVYDPVSPPKAHNVLLSECMPFIAYMKPNYDEFIALSRFVINESEEIYEENEDGEENEDEDEDEDEDELDEEKIFELGIEHFLTQYPDLTILLTRGKYAYLYNGQEGGDFLKQTVESTIPEEDIVSRTGCGDSFLSGFLAAKIRDPELVDGDALSVARDAAQTSLYSTSAINPAIGEIVFVDDEL